MTVGRRNYTAGAALSRARVCVSQRFEYLAFISALLFSLLILGACIFTQSAKAQTAKPGIVGFGDLVVSGASGTLPPPANPPLPPGVNELDETFINPDGASLKIFDVRTPGGLPDAQLLNAPTKYQAFARDIGQVFGLALDKANPPNIYAASTSVHGLHIVVPDSDGDGRPERIKIGQPGAQWMNGQFGVARGGGPGTVWKINGETGEITKFADILSNGAPNSGAGLGNITFDARHKQFFVTNFGTGQIHRLDNNGNDLETFDHGLQGRPANGMDAVPLDAANQLNINSPAFDAEDSQSWGLASPERRTWGVAVRSNRLYYSIEAGPQIWSVGINKDGSFGGDPRWELDVPSDPNAYPVSDIAFTGSGQMLLAQRGGITSRYDYSQYHTPRKTRVLRYKLESPDIPETPSRWVAEPEDYAIGFPGIHRNTSGGIAIGYGYKKKPDGSYGFGSCEGTLWSTGDALRDNPVHGAKLAQGGPLNVHGLQGNALSLVRPQNVPPWSSYYVDFDSQFEDPQASGHVGDVEIPRECHRKRVDIMDLRIIKRAKPEHCTAGNRCDFDVEIKNVGTKTYSGPLIIQDVSHSGAVLIGHTPPPPAPGWDCKEHFPGSGIYECTHPGVTLKPGQTTSLELQFTTPGWWNRPVYNNCVDLRVPGAGIDQRLYNNRSCDYVAFCKPGEPGCEPDLQLEKYGRYGACDFFGVCEFSVIITNVGPVPYTGQLNVTDVATTPGATLIDWSPKPEWNCAALGPDNYGCSTTAPVTLAPGEFRELIILVQGPPIVPGFTHVRNCAYIDWNGFPPDSNPHNEYDCAVISSLPPGHPDARATVEIQKDALPTCSRAGPGTPWTCVYTVRISNSGTAPLNGPIVFTDEVTAHPATLIGLFGAPGAWSCAPGIGSTGPFTCTHPAIPGGLLPGQETLLYLGFDLPAAIPVPSWELNCAKTQWDNDGDGAAEDHEACALSLVCDAGSANCPQDLAVIKRPQVGSCPKGTSCPFSIDVQNLASVNYPGPVTVTDIPDPGTGPANVLTPGWACAPAGGSYTCTHPAGIAPSAFASFDIEFPIPAGYTTNTFENCAEVAPGPGNDFPFNDRDCGTSVVPQPLPADLSPWSDTTCKKGASCKLPGRIDNLGEQAFNGSAGVRGVLSPELKIIGITSKTHNFSCKTSGNAGYECSGSSLSIAPGKAVEYEITVSVPANFPHRQVSHIKNMVWPDQKVKDKNPQNDQHISIITIEQDKTPPPPPPPPPPPAGKPDLTVSKTANQPVCNANQGCNFLVTVSNVGTAVYSGGVTLRDTITPASARYTGANPRGWNCTGNAGSVTCTKPNVNLAPGAKESIYLSFSVPRYQSGTANNCVVVSPGVAAAPRGGNTVSNVQSALSAQGYYKGRIDGKSGPQTSAAVREYQRLYNMPQTGQINSVLLDRLLGSSGATAGGTDANPNNNRDCASVSIQGEAPPPPPPSCRGGQYLSSRGQCVCPSHKPIWTGSKCIPRKPQQCTGGRLRNHKGICVCPTSKPNWNGNFCFAKEVLCSGGRIRQNGICVCPPSLPKWNGQYCAGIPGPQQCTGGRYRSSNGKCLCPSSAPNWTGVICIPKINLCSGGRTFSFQKKKCVCPVSLPNWNGKSCGGIQGPLCSGGRIQNRSGKCVCPSNKPKWNGYSCISSSGGGGHGGCKPGYSRNSHGTCMPISIGGGVKPLPSPVCSGGRIRKNGKCACPSNKPLWIGGKCNSFPGGIKFPGIKIQ